jgi:LmbE family N-acetylglucosaminyl deacetylase
MKNEFIKKIVKEKIPCYFVSPHFDDAVLSAGDLLAYLSKSTKVTVVNVFTKAGNYNTLSAKRFLSLSGKYKDASKLFVDRDNEDSITLANLPIKRINFNFIDALWRRCQGGLSRKLFTKIVPEIGSVYPTYRLHVASGRINKEDSKLIIRLTKKLKKVVRENHAIVFCPMGVGNHVDHLITKIVCEERFKNICFWLDFPYSEKRVTGRSQPKNNSLKSFKFKNNFTIKEKLVRSYKTQFKGLFPKNKVNLVPETYYLQK